MIAGGPVGRYVGGMVLGWKELDRRDGGGGYLRVQIGILVGIGSLLGLITLVSGVGATEPSDTAVNPSFGTESFPRNGIVRC
jgi:hypothetical protein